MRYRSKKFRQNPFTTFSVIRRTDRQTNRQTDGSENITSFGGGNNNNNNNNVRSRWGPVPGFKNLSTGSSKL